MASEQDRLKKELLAREESLMRNDTRNDPDKVAGLIDDHCVEVTVAGKQRDYRRGDSFESVDGELYIDDSTVRMIDISDDAKLLLYVGAKVKKNLRLKSSFCSIWKSIDGEWKMIFHQGTSIAD